MTRMLASLLLLQLIAPVAFAVKLRNQEPPEPVVKANVNANLPSSQQQNQFVLDEGNDRTLQEAECESSTYIPFTANIVVDLRGFPGRLNPNEKTRVGTAIMDVYNEIVDCGTGDFYRQITSATLTPATFDDEGETTFSLIYAIQGTCQGCTVASSGTTRLFTYVDRNGGGASAFSDPCPCVGPSIFSFRVLLKQRIELLILNKLTSNILWLEEVSELEDTPSCQDIQTFTSSSVVIEFYGCPSALEEWEFYDLGEKFVQAYNRTNGKNARLCDPFFREIVSAVPVFDGGNITDVPSARDRGREMAESNEFMTTNAATASGDTRALQAAAGDSSCDEYFEVRYEITAVCRNCDLSKITLFDEPDAVNFFSGDDGDDGDDSDRNLYTTEHGAAHNHWENIYGHHDDEEKHARRSLYGSSECQCPLDTSFRAITEDEMTAAFGLAISLSTSLKVEDIVEIMPISCNPDVETFETFVDVIYEFESEDGTVPQEDAAAFVANFLLSYNSLQARYCDPYFREVASAEIADQNAIRTRRDRSLQTKKASTKFTVTIRVAVVGTCRGCTGTKRKLFVNDAPRRLQVSEKATVPDAESNPKYRRIQSDDECFCAVANVANSAPTEREFLVGYNGELSEFGREYIATAVNEEDSEGGEDYEARQECTANLDCLDSGKGGLCVNFFCIHAGNPRVTLTWEGDDDLDLAVYTPFGVRIDYYNDFDDDTGGSFDTLFSQDVFAPHVESIFFPMKGGPLGTYIIDVSTWEERDSADEWKVEVFTADSGSEPVIVATGVGNRDDIVFDFGELGGSQIDGVCSTSNTRTECCSDSDCSGSNQRCANRQCVTTGNRTFTLSWAGNDDYTLTVLTPKGGRISARSPLDPNSGAVFESDKNFDAVSPSFHTENIHFPRGIPGGEYVFYVDAIAQLGPAEEWSLEVIEFGESVVVETGYGYSNVLQYIAPECTSTQHCRKGEVCFNTRCIVNGTPRFTLTWNGDDDLDLSVSPPLGKIVDWWKQFDSRSGGRLQDDTTPMGTSHVESIYFGVSRRALTGRYVVKVDAYETHGDSSDPWKLKVSVRGKVVKSWSGTGDASFRFWYGG